jgi:hypothetical protein
MPRGISWDQLPLPHERYRDDDRAKGGTVSTVTVPSQATDAEPLATEERCVASKRLDSYLYILILTCVRDIVKDLSNIARRGAFGLICGSITGATLGAGI